MIKKQNKKKIVLPTSPIKLDLKLKAKESRGVGMAAKFIDSLITVQ